MREPPIERESSSANWRIAFTPWKFGVCLLAIGLWIGTIAVLDSLIPGDTIHATTKRVNGGVEFTITSFKGGLLNIATILGFVCIPGLLIWWFWPQLSKEHYRFREKPGTDTTGPLVIRVGAYCIIGILSALILWIIFIVVVLEPLNCVYRVAVRGDDIHVESLYRSWDVSRGNIQQVRATREVRDTRGGRGAEFRAEFRLRNGDMFRTPSNIIARPPGGPEDKQYETFFDELRNELTQKP